MFLVNRKATKMGGKTMWIKFTKSLYIVVSAIIGISDAVADQNAITLSVDKANVSPGDTIVFEATPSGVVTSPFYLTDSGYIRLEDNTPPYQWTMTLSKKASGSKNFEVHAIVDGKIQASNVVTVTVLADTSLLSQIIFEPGEQLLMSPGMKKQLRVIGRFKDGHNRNITQSVTGTTYGENIVSGLNVTSGDSPVISVSPEGEVLAQALGEAEIVATNNGVSNVRRILVVPVSKDDAGSPQFSSPSIAVAENAGTLTLTVRRVGGSQGELTVNYATTDGTAKDGSDYVGTTGSLTWADGDSSDKTLTVTITDDSLSEGNETFTVSLSDAVSGESLDSATVTITDNDNGQPGTPQFTDFHPKVAENVGAVTLTVSRVGGANGELTVNYATTDDTATDGSDYVGATGSLTWADGDSSNKSFTVAIINDSLSENDETFIVTLSDPSGTDLDSATVTIDKNNPTVVTLVDFSATALKNEILLEWQTAFELDNAGFHIWRATGEGWKNGDYSSVIRLTEQLLPAQGNWSLYSYIDADVESGATYYYGLEDIDLSGHSTFHWDNIDSATAK